MIKRICKYIGCKKEIEGYSIKHVDFLMAQHEYTHIRKEKKEQEKQKEKQNEPTD